MDGVRGRWVKRFAAVAAALGWTALAIQLYLTVNMSMASGKGRLAGLVTYFSFFTILTNILVAMALTAPLVRGSSRITAFFSRPSVNTGIATSIAVGGIAYVLLLRHVWDPKGLQLVADVLLHYVMPVLYIVYWWLAVPKGDLRRADVWYWMLYPVAYWLFAMVRGALTGFYPYHFIDAGTLGYTRAFANAVGVLLGFVAVALLLVAAGRLQGAATLSTSSQSERSGR